MLGSAVKIAVSPQTQRRGGTVGNTAQKREGACRRDLVCGSVLRQSVEIAVIAEDWGGIGICAVGSSAEAVENGHCAGWCYAENGAYAVRPSPHRRTIEIPVEA